MKLADALDALTGREGGYVDNPADRGGPTNWGITEAVARAFGYLGDMRLMPRTTALQIYRERYWSQPHFDQVSLIFPALAEKLLDAGVNMGTVTGGIFLQRALNTLNAGATTFPDLAVDGSIGRMTIYGLKQFLAQRGDEGRGVLLEMVNAQQSVRYMDIAEHDRSQETFEYGWQKNRILHPA